MCIFPRKVRGIIEKFVFDHENFDKASMTAFSMLCVNGSLSIESAGCTQDQTLANLHGWPPGQKKKEGSL